MEIKNSTEDKSKVIMTVAAIVFAGALFGVLGYLLGSGNNSDNSKTGNGAENQAVRNQEINQNMETEKEEINGENKEEAENIKDETAGWQMYTNDKYGFEVKYPSDWKYNEGNQTNPSKSQPHIVAFGKSVPAQDYPVIIIQRFSEKDVVGKMFKNGSLIFDIITLWNANPEYPVSQEILSTFKFTN